MKETMSKKDSVTVLFNQLTQPSVDTLYALQALGLIEHMDCSTEKGLNGFFNFLQKLDIKPSQRATLLAIDFHLDYSVKVLGKPLAEWILQQGRQYKNYWDVLLSDISKDKLTPSQLDDFFSNNTMKLLSNLENFESILKKSNLQQKYIDVFQNIKKEYRWVFQTDIAQMHQTFEHSRMRELSGDDVVLLMELWRAQSESIYNTSIASPFTMGNKQTESPVFLLSAVQAQDVVSNFVEKDWKLFFTNNNSKNLEQKVKLFFELLPVENNSKTMLFELFKAYSGWSQGSNQFNRSVAEEMRKFLRKACRHYIFGDSDLEDKKEMFRRWTKLWTKTEPDIEKKMYNFVSENNVFSDILSGNHTTSKIASISAFMTYATDEEMQQYCAEISDTIIEEKDMTLNDAVSRRVLKLLKGIELDSPKRPVLAQIYWLSMLGESVSAMQNRLHNALRLEEVKDTHPQLNVFIDLPDTEKVNKMIELAMPRAYDEGKVMLSKAQLLLNLNSIVPTAPAAKRKI